MRKPTARELVLGQRAIESFDLEKSGETLVYVLRGVERGRYVSHLWLVPWKGGRPRRLTHGFVRDTLAAISPDGRRVAFVRASASEDAEDAQLWILPLDGGDAWQLTHLAHGASSPRWSPDGSRVALLAQAGPQRFAVGPERSAKPPMARVMRRTDFRDDESGYLSRRTHLFVTPVREGARPRQVTSGDFDVSAPAWSPAGEWLAFAADMGADANITPRTTLHRVAAGGGQVLPLAELAGDAAAPTISPDGRFVAFHGTDVADPPDETITRIWIAPVDHAGLTGGAPRTLTGTLDRSATNGAWADLVMAEDVPGPLWLDAEHLVFMAGDTGRNVPMVVSLEGAVRRLIDPGRVVGAGLATASGRIALSAGNDGRGAELYALEGWHAGEGTMRRLTRNGTSWQRRFPRPRIDELWIDGSGGAIQTWLVSPADALDGPMPAIIILHGGPTGGHAPGGTLDSTMLAGHGYRVVEPNIRGSDTFGAAWIAALGGRWGEVDMADVLSVLDGLQARGLVDPSRVGVMGLSYGGYLVQWMLGATDRFRAGVAENGVANQASTWANSHFGVHYNRRARLGDPLSDAGMQKLWSTSPLRNAASVRTPLLMLQAEEDRICPAADNEQLFTALKVLGREVEYVLYPEEHHEMKNYGRPDRRIDRMQRILAWFDRWLEPAAGG
jgi:dipeptidyl aminopeptidase/acylaminoacyl peptidase